MKITDLSCGPFYLDGGSIFGVVPKIKWNTYLTPNADNQIELGLNPVLIETGNRKILIDCGTFQSSAKLLNSLATFNVSPKEITDIVFTHLHFDHMTGALKENRENFVPVFENAICYCSEIELQSALNPDDRTKHFYNLEAVSFLSRQGLLKPIKLNDDFLKDIYIVHASGHTEGHIAVVIYEEIQHIIGGDAIPTEYHLNVNYMTAFDENLKQNLKTKKQLLEMAVLRKTMIHFYHSPKIISGYLTKEKKRYKLIS